MLHGWSRAARAGALAAALCLGVAACEVETLDLVPSYPGATLGPGYRIQEGSVLSLKQMYYTPDSYAEVLQFYKNYVAHETGWKGAPEHEMSIWTNNMTLDQSMTSAKAIDPTKVGKLVVVVNEGTRTTIRTFSSQPKG